MNKTLHPHPIDDDPLVSVILPVYNHCAFVAAAIKSVFAQTYRPIEFIIIDDGSVDGSVNEVRKLLAQKPPQEGIHVIFIARNNRGAAATINEGIDLARGTYLAILNSDDFYFPERLERCIAAAEHHCARLVFSYVEPVADNGAPLHLDHRWRIWYNDAVIRELDLAPSLSFLLLTHNIAVSSGNFVFRRELIDDIGKFENYRYAHDLDFLLRASLLEEPVLVREKLYGYRVHEYNTISAPEASVDSECATIIRNYLIAASGSQTKNPLAPSYDNWPNSLSSLTPTSARVFTRVLDDFVESPPVLAKQQDLTRVEAEVSGTFTILTHELSHTGAPALAVAISKALKSAGAKVSVLSMRDGPLREDCLRTGIPIHIGGEGFILQLLKKLRSTLPIFYKMVRWISSWRLFHHLLLPLALPAILVGLRLTARKSGTLLINSFASFPLAFEILPRWRGPVFWYIHETYDPQILLRSEAARKTLQLFRDHKKITFLYGSDATRRVWASEGFDGKVLYWSGLSHSSVPTALRSEQKSHKKRTVLSVGTSGPRKGTRTLIEAFAQACRKGSIPDETQLVIVGMIPPSVNIHSRDIVLRTIRPDLRGRVRLIATVDPATLASYYEDADLYVQTSNMECLPLALLTAMAHSIPIITTDVDGCKEAIVDGECGLTVPPRNAVRLADAMGQLLGDSNKSRQFAQAARIRFEAVFSLEKTLERMFETISPTGRGGHPRTISSVQIDAPTLSEALE